MPIPRFLDARLNENDGTSSLAANCSSIHPNHQGTQTSSLVHDDTEEAWYGGSSHDGSNLMASKAINEATCTDRAELMLRIKKGESPQWASNHCPQQELQRQDLVVQKPHITVSESARALDTVDYPLKQGRTPAEGHDLLASPAEIERPPSALHSGDFKPPAFELGQENDRFSGTELERHDLAFDPNHGMSSILPDHEEAAPWLLNRIRRHRSPDRRRSANLSGSKYVLTWPTTPLVQQSTNPDLTLSQEGPASSRGSGRRHTLPPPRHDDWNSHDGKCISDQSVEEWNTSRDLTTLAMQPSRRSSTFPWTLQASSPPRPGYLRSQRGSITLETSPRPHASMVGSYEESILHGRMSTAPSKPFCFQASIGALGRGSKPKMPPHITVPFQAVFYDWTGNTRLPSFHDEPSPYVGEIDLLRNTLMPSTDHGHSQAQIPSDCAKLISDKPGDPRTYTLPKSQRERRVSTLPPEGGYRVPERGQIQVVIKNAYKTALKLFLVPYDLTGIEPGQKTFVRQRYYSRGPIIERPVVVQAEKAIADMQSRPTLRYLVHLKLCCPEKRHYYLYGTIRVVFANRVPDDKEHLSKELQEPSPKFSPWRPCQAGNRKATTPSKHNGDRAFRRRSYEVRPTIYAARSYSVSDPFKDTSIPPMPPIPTIFDAHDITLEESTPMHRRQSEISWSASDSKASPRSQVLIANGREEDYVKLERGERGYGGSRSGTPQPGNGLLAQRLKAQDKGE